MISNTVYIGGKRYKWIDPFAKSDEWKAILDWADYEGALPPTNDIPFDQLIKDLKSAGIWQKLDVFYVFAGDGSNGFKLINWIDPNNHYADAYGGLTWDLDGVKGNGSNGYIDTNYNAALDGINYLLEDACRFAILSEEGTGSNFNRNTIDGTFSGANAMMNFSTPYHRINTGGQVPGVGEVDLTGTGFKGIFKGIGTEEYLISKDVLSNRNRISTGITDSKQIIHRNAGSNYGTNIKISCYGMGGKLTYAETQSFRTIYNNFLTSLGLTPVA